MNYNYPTIAILIITYNRLTLIKRVIAALQKRIKYPAEKIEWIVSDDSTGDNYLDRLSKIKSLQNVTFISTRERAGWGKNVNGALKHIHNKTQASYVFQIEDDYLLNKDLNLLAGVALLETMPHIGMLRYRGTSGDRIISHQFVANIMGVYPQFLESKGANAGWLAYQQIDMASPTAYIYSNGPHLKRIGETGFHAFYGEYPENKKLGDTEIAFCIRVKKMMSQDNAPGIAILPEWIPMHFSHLGKTWKDTEHDI